MASRYEDTLAGAVAAAVGTAQRDGVVIEARARQWLAEQEDYHRATYGPPDWTLPGGMAMAKAVAEAEARDLRPQFSGTTQEFAALMQRRLPWTTVDVGPDADQVAARASLARQLGDLDARHFR